MGKVKNKLTEEQMLVEAFVSAKEGLEAAKSVLSEAEAALLNYCENMQLKHGDRLANRLKYTVEDSYALVAADGGNVTAKVKEALIKHLGVNSHYVTHKPNVDVKLMYKSFYTDGKLLDALNAVQLSVIKKTKQGLDFI